MDSTKRILVLTLIVLAGVFLYMIWNKGHTAVATSNDGQQVFVVSSAFASLQPLPVDYTCQGDNVNPPLSIGNLPDGTVSLAVDLTEPAGVFSGAQGHWMVWNIPESTTVIPRDVGDSLGVVGKNDDGSNRYFGPCPSSGTHHYTFDVYALNASLDIPADSSYEQFLAAVQKRLIRSGTLTVTYQRQAVTAAARQ